MECGLATSITDDRKRERQELFNSWIDRYHEHTGLSFAEILDLAMVKEHMKTEGIKEYTGNGADDVLS